MNKIKTLIDAKGTTLNDFYREAILSGSSDITWSSLCNWYYGRSFPKNGRLKQMAKLLNVAPFELMNDDLLEREI